MANLTLTIDEDVLRRARIKAIEQKTSVNAIVREFLESYSQADDTKAIEEFLEIANRNASSSGPGGRTWTREEIYEERLGRFSAG